MPVRARVANPAPSHASPPPTHCRAAPLIVFTPYPLRCAAPLKMSNGRELMEMVCQSYDSPPEEVEEFEEGHDFSGFRLLLLRHK